MIREAQEHFDVLVIGGGPAGMAAAVRAAECSVRVGIVDDNAAPGGQIWRRGVEEDGLTPEATRWRQLLWNSSITRLCGRSVFDLPSPGVVWAEGPAGLCELHYRNLVLATGARERFLPFPGWTLPNVTGAGGLQALVKSGLRIHGRRVVVAGTGPLLLAVAAYLRKHGAEIPLVCEQASWASLAQFTAALIRHPGKIKEGLELKLELRGVPLVANTWPLAANGRHALESVDILRGGQRESIACDYLACGFHLVPNIELPMLLGCKIEEGLVQVDGMQQTSVDRVFCAGEPTGIGGLELSLIEGQIAGLAAAGDAAKARALFHQRRKARSFARILDRAFHLRSELRKLATAETIVCRCEDISYSRLQEQTSWRAAKLHTRCGMGPCQGRVCGTATQFLFNWNVDSFRPPIFPVRVESLSDMTARKVANTVRS